MCLRQQVPSVVFLEATDSPHSVWTKHLPDTRVWEIRFFGFSVFYFKKAAQSHQSLLTRAPPYAACDRSVLCVLLVSSLRIPRRHVLEGRESSSEYTLLHQQGRSKEKRLLPWAEVGLTLLLPCCGRSGPRVSRWLTGGEAHRDRGKSPMPPGLPWDDVSLRALWKRLLDPQESSDHTLRRL